MAYEIPYDSNYSEWYGVPQNVTRLSAVLQQATDEDGNSIGRITANWDTPDNGGTFVAQVSTDGENYTIVETNIRQNSAVLTVLPNTDYYLKIVTVLDINQSDGTVSDLLSATDIPTPNTPVVTATPSGLRIDVGIIPQGYTANISIDNGEDIDYVDTSNLVYMYLCNAGTYKVSTAFMDVNGNIGSYSSAVVVIVNDVYNLKTPLLNGYVVVDDGGDYYVDTAGAMILRHSTQYFTKYNDLPALAGIFNRGGYRTPLLVSTIEDAVKIQRTNDTVYSSQGSFEDENGILWYYCACTSYNYGWDETVLEQNYPTINYAGSSAESAARELIAEADPTVFPASSIEENLFYPTSVSLSSGDTISDETLKSLIVYHRPITINGTVYTPSDYTNGTYTYYALQNGSNSTEIKKAQISSSWVITITTESAGGGGGSYTAGDGIDISNDVISLDIASANDIGGIKVGDGLSIDANGVLSASGGGGGSGLTSTILFEDENGWSSGNIILNDSLDNYDFITFYYRGTSDTTHMLNMIFDADTLYNRVGQYSDITGYDNRYFNFLIYSKTQLNYDSRNVYAIYKIVGHKISGGSGGGGTPYTETVLFSNASGVSSGTINLSGNISDYDLINVVIWNGSTGGENSILYTSSDILNLFSSAGIISTLFDNKYVQWKIVNDNSLTIVDNDGTTKIYKITGIKFGRYVSGVAVDTTVTQGSSNVVTSGAVYDYIASLEARIQALESQLS